MSVPYAQCCYEPRTTLKNKVLIKKFLKNNCTKLLKTNKHDLQSKHIWKWTRLGAQRDAKLKGMKLFHRVP